MNLELESLLNIPNFHFVSACFLTLYVPDQIIIYLVW